jgi:hypothetical protein
MINLFNGARPTKDFPVSGLAARGRQCEAISSGPGHVRLAEHAGRIYLDLADEYWRAVEIGPDGWRVINSPAVRSREGRAGTRMIKINAAPHGSANSAPRPHRDGRTAYTQCHRVT